MAETRVFITVGEVSGDLHAAELICSLRALDPSIRCEGYGGPAMRDAGAIIHHETVGRSAMLFNAAVRAREVWRLLRQTRRAYRSDPPQLHVCIDSSGMNLHFARVAREAGVPVLYYIAPQLWASRPGRIKQVRAYVDRVACILPFEEEYYRQRGVRADFVGHPLFDELPADRAPAPGPRFPAVPPMVGIMPGSRRSEVRANLPHLLDVAAQVRAAFPGTTYLVPTTPNTHELVRQMAGGFEGIEIESGAVNRMMPRCDLCLAKSGTTTLHVAAYGVPMIVVYRLSWLMWNLIGRWLVKTPSIALVNILAECGAADAQGLPRRRVVSEVVPWYGSNCPVAEMAVDLLRDPAKLAAQRADLLKLVAALDRRGASLNAATIALEMIAQRRSSAAAG